MNYFLLSFDRKNDAIDSSKLREGLIAAFYKEVSKVTSNEESSLRIESEERFEILENLLQPFREKMYFSFVQIMANRKKELFESIEENKKKQLTFEEIVRHMELSGGMEQSH